VIKPERRTAYARKCDGLRRWLFPVMTQTGFSRPFCISLVEVHGRHLSASRNKRSGATFRFVLPFHQEDAL